MIPLLKKPFLGLDDLNIFVATLPFVSKVLERVAASQLQGFLDFWGYLDSFQSGFRPGLGNGTALVTLVDNLKRITERRKASLLILHSLLAVFNISTIEIFWDTWLFCAGKWHVPQCVTSSLFC